MNINPLYITNVLKILQKYVDLQYYKKLGHRHIYNRLIINKSKISTIENLKRIKFYLIHRQFLYK